MPQPVIISPALETDLPAIGEVSVCSWQLAYRDLLPADYLASLSVAQRTLGWQGLMAGGSMKLLVARADDAQPGSPVCGFAAFGASRDPDHPPQTGEIMALYLSPAHWSTGIGRALMAATIRALSADGHRRVALWVLSGNVRAIRFYRAAGFVAEPDKVKSFSLGGVTLTEQRFSRDLGA
jgi:ribosomal protein S18 acetylase RimI-like enzyme